jgi:hypothetical protein
VKTKSINSEEDSRGAKIKGTVGTGSSQKFCKKSGRDFQSQADYFYQEEIEAYDFIKAFHKHGTLPSSEAVRHTVKLPTIPAPLWSLS